MAAPHILPRGFPTRPLSEQSYTGLAAFLERQVGEGLTLDYKRELSDSSKARGELCRGVSALANSHSETIIYGVDEQESGRTPVLPYLWASRAWEGRWTSKLRRSPERDRIRGVMPPLGLLTGRCATLIGGGRDLLGRGRGLRMPERRPRHVLGARVKMCSRLPRT